MVNKNKRVYLPIDYIPIGSALTFIKTLPELGKWGYAKALYKCVCGKEKDINIGNVKQGRTLSCGCLFKLSIHPNITHGLTKHPLFRIWSDIKTRCYNKKSWAYPYYGGKGVAMCEEWLHNPKVFIEWAIDNGWGKGMSIDKDKIPQSLGIEGLIYSPKMCCFLTHKENCNHRKSNHPITLKGVTKNMTTWEKQLGFPKDLIYTRLKNKWSIERALTTPVFKNYQGNHKK